MSKTSLEVNTKLEFQLNVRKWNNEKSLIRNYYTQLKPRITNTIKNNVKLVSSKTIIN